MKNLKKASLPLYAAFSGIFLIAILYCVLGTSYPMQDNGDTVTLSISRSLSFSLSWGFWRVFGLILWVGTGLLFLAFENDLIGKTEGSFWYYVDRSRILVIAIMLFSFILTVFVPMKTNYNAIVDKAKYEQIKDNKDSLKVLFPKHKLF